MNIKTKQIKTGKKQKDPPGENPTSSVIYHALQPKDFKYNAQQETH